MRRHSTFLIAALALAACATAQEPGASIEAPSGSRVVLQAQGTGIQTYACTQAENGFKWVFKGPEAKLLDAAGNEIGTHFAGPTWKLADGSQVQGEVMASRPSPDAGSVPWLLLHAKAGTATGKFAGIAFIRRTETKGGAAPAAGCENATDADKTARVPYSATYSFYDAPRE